MDDVETRRAKTGTTVAAALGASGTARHLTDGEVLVAEGDPADDVFVIVSGEAAVFASTPEGPVAVATMGAGEVVGEVTAFAGGARTATVVAHGSLEVSVLDRGELQRWLDEHPEAANELTSAARRRIDRSQIASLVSALVGSADPALVGELLDAVLWRRLAPGEVLFDEGDPSDAAYVVVSGRLVAIEPSDDGASTVANELGRGEVVGELGLLDDAPRSARVEAVRDTTLAALPTDTFEALVERHPALLLRITRAILSRLRSPRRPTDRAASLTIAVTAPAVDRRAILEGIVAEVGRHGSVEHLASARVDELLDRPGIAQAAGHDAGAARLAELLHTAEVQRDHVILETDDELTAWSRRAVAHADRLLVVASARPAPDERRLISALTGEVRSERVARTLALVHPPSADRPAGTPVVADAVGIDHVVHLRHGSDDDLARLARLATGHGVGLVLGGGGARAFAHLGAYRALRESEVPIDAVVACSIGAPLAGGIAQDVRLDSLDEVAEAQFHKLLDYTVPVVALLKGERISTSIGDRFGTWDIQDLWLPYACVSTNLTRARLEVHRRGDASKAIRASVAIPGVLPPVPHDGDLLVDGAVLDNLPIGVLRDDASIGTIIAIDVAPPQGPRAKTDFGTSMSGTRALLAAVTGRGGSYPRASAVLMRSMFTGSAQRQREALDAGVVDLLLSLHLPGVGLLEFENVREVSAAGYEAALPEVRRWAADRPWMGGPT